MTIVIGMVASSALTVTALLCIKCCGKKSEKKVSYGDANEINKRIQEKIELFYAQQENMLLDTARTNSAEAESIAVQLTLLHNKQKELLDELAQGNEQSLMEKLRELKNPSMLQP